MENNETFKWVQVAGTLEIPGIDHTYYLLLPRSVERDTWMNDDMSVFYVAHHGGVPHHIVIKGPFVIDYVYAGETIQIKEEKTQIYFDDEPEWLQKELRGEPASLAE